MIIRTEPSHFGKRVHRYKITYQVASINRWGAVSSIESFERLKPSQDPVQMLKDQYQRYLKYYPIDHLQSYSPVTAIKCIRDTSRAGIGYDAPLGSYLRVVYTPLDIDQKYFDRYYRIFQEDSKSSEVRQFVRDFLNQNVFQYTLQFNDPEDWDTEGLFTSRHY